ncbi:MAG: esterase [Maribacter sp.]|nr:MAG: esterase [Maribacter sp.]
MNQQEKQVVYKTTNTYTTLNTLSNTTKNVWIVFHGIGYLSTYFLKYFDELPPEENYIIAPQAPSKYYLNNAYRHVGASWLTKENTITETENIISYLEAVYRAENITQQYKLIVFGFSQGVSIASRWVAKKQLKCDQLVLYAGGLPNELTASDFKFLEANNTEVTILVGNSDKYLTEKRRQTESKKIKTLFHDRAEQLVFDGGHEVKKELINSLV